jgi:hypothetical protein
LYQDNELFGQRSSTSSDDAIHPPTDNGRLISVFSPKEKELIDWGRGKFLSPTLQDDKHCRHEMLKAFKAV